ncbi:MAG: repressor LexA, partial [Tissierellia bacterium]|nr:repressor LexA [Tissierellia bacterium]
IKASNILDEETYQDIDRIGRASGGKGQPQKLVKNSPLRSGIFQLMHRYDHLLELEGHVDFRTMNLFALEEARRNLKGKYTHIIIDESQDLTKVQLEFLKCIYQDKAYSSIMFVADNTQSIYPHSWLGKGRPYTTIGYDMSGRSRMLSKNFRTTTEISKAAYGLIEHDENIRNNVDFVKPSLIDRHGHPPIYKCFQDQQGQLEFLYDEIQTIRNDYSYGEICVVARERRILENTLNYLESKGIECEILRRRKPDFDSDKVKLLTLHSIKGLEFKVVFLIDINEDIIPNSIMVDFDDEDNHDSEERKLLYVGMTRANELLYISSAGKPSKFIKEIENDYLRIKRDCSMRPYQSLAINEYKLKDRLIDINAREELIRQWFIRELINTYKYPLELIDLEHPVYLFSKKGYVDLVVNIYNRGKRTPYIFAEFKRFGAGIEDAIGQLKTYMQTDDTVQYGVVTDGLQVSIFDRNEDILNDIPRCNPYFLPDNKEKTRYINFKNQEEYLYTYDKDDRSNIEITNYKTELIMDYQNCSKIPIVGEIAAGIPTVVNREYENYLQIPNEWIYSTERTFALEVTGNSMNGIWIERGDAVIVHQQDNAINGDIIVAIINGEATIKRYMTMGDSILLLSENNDFEPIQMKEEDIAINGKVIGVMKLCGDI